jgi:hypothetical protein
MHAHWPFLKRGQNGTEPVRFCRGKESGQKNGICKGQLLKQTTKIAGRRTAQCFARTFHLPFIDHAHQFDATQNGARS